MHIGFVIYGSLDTRSGGYLYDRKLVEFLQNQGDRVSLFSLPWRSYPQHLLQNLWWGWASALAASQLDILIQDELNHPSLFWLNRHLKAEADFPIVTLVHHLRSSEVHPKGLTPLYRAIEKRYLLTTDGFICNSHSTEQAALALAGVSRPTVVAYPGRDDGPPPLQEHEILARAQSDGPLRLLFVGNLIPRKGLHTLLEAMAHVPADQVQLTVVGDDSIDPRYSHRMRTLAHHHQLDTRIHWAGAVSDETLRQLYSTHHALVVPSQHEGFGIVYLEAMSYGLIAVGTEAGGAGEIIRPGETGLLIPPEDAETLATKLLWLQSHRPEMGEMGIAARRAWMNHPTWSDTGARIRTFLQAQLA